MLDTVPRPQLSTLWTNAGPVVYDETDIYLTMQLTGPAPAGGAKISLKLSNLSILHNPWGPPNDPDDPGSIMLKQNVNAGEMGATTSIRAFPVTQAEPLVVTAFYGGVQKQLALTIVPRTGVALSSLAVTPEALIGGQGATGTVMLNHARPC